MIRFTGSLLLNTIQTDSRVSVIYEKGEVGGDGGDGGDLGWPGWR